MIKQETFRVTYEEIISSESEFKLKALIISKAKECGWPLLLSTSLDIKLPKGYEVSHAEDFQDLSISFKLKALGND